MHGWNYRFGTECRKPPSPECAAGWASSSAMPRLPAATPTFPRSLECDLAVLRQLGRFLTDQGIRGHGSGCPAPCEQSRERRHSARSDARLGNGDSRRRSSARPPEPLVMWGDRRSCEVSVGRPQRPKGGLLPTDAKRSSRHDVAVGMGVQVGDHVGKLRRARSFCRHLLSRRW